MNKIISYLLISLVTGLMISSCGTTKKASNQVYIDPYLNKTDNELSPTDKYIKKFRDLAMAEMERSGVPASITLAQGILESGNGNSFLAQQANNHFGIKCQNWAGDEIYLDDDKENECFRKYSSVEESFKDHSDFLRANPRYESLFALEKTDFKGWANGLKEAGYATRRNYAELLIDLVQKHKLNMYDIKTTYKQPASDKNSGAKEAFNFNGIKAYTVKKGETYLSIAKKFNMDVPTLLSYNDLDTETPLLAEAILYLRPKKSKAKESYHIVKKTDNLYSISQEYGVKLASLLQFNMLQEGDEPAVGEILYLKSARKESPELRTIVETTPEVVTEPEPGKYVNIESKENDKITIEPSNELTKEPVINETKYEEVTPTNELTTKSNEGKVEIKTEKKVEDILREAENDNPYKNIEVTKPKTEKPATVSAAPTTQVDFHFVQKGETLYSISKKHNVSVSDLQTWNKLSGNTLDIGDTLIIKQSTNQPGVAVTKPSPKLGQPNTSPGVNTQGGDTIFHIVKPQETLYTISREYKTTIIDLISMNKLDKYEIEPGQKIVIELPKTSVTVRPDRTTTNQDPFIRPTLKTKPATTSTTKTTSSKSTYHIVSKGETLYSISKKYNITVLRLKELNNLTSNNIDIGQRLVVETERVAPANNNVPVNRINNNTNQKYHVVQVDETLFSIARKYNLTVQRLKALNNLPGNTINVGQKLIVE